MDLGASRKESLMKQMKNDCYKSIQELEDIKRKAIQKIDEIFSKFQINCLHEWKDLNGLKSFADVRESSLRLEHKTTRVTHFFTDLPVLMEEQIEVANQNEATAKCEQNGRIGSVYTTRVTTGVSSDVDKSSFVEMGDLLNLLDDPSCVPVEDTPAKVLPKFSHRTKEEKPLEKEKSPKKKTAPERETSEELSGHAEQHSVESSSWVKPSPPIFIFETGEGQPPLFQISGECEFSARVCHSESPKLFYIQMKAYSQTIASLTNEITNSMVDAAATGMKHQLSSCNPRRISRSSIPCIGITFSSEWQNYFRAYLRRNLAGNRVEVYYIDWGSVEVVPLNYCFELLPQFEKQPAYALACSLSPGENDDEEGSHLRNAEDINIIWPISAGPFFQKHYLWKTVQVKVLRSKQSQVSSDYDMIIYDVVVSLKDKNIFKELKSNRIIPQIQPR